MGRDTLRERIEKIFEENYVETAEGWNKVINPILALIQDEIEKELDKLT